MNGRDPGILVRFSPSGIDVVRILLGISVNLIESGASNRRAMEIGRDALSF